MIFKEKYNKLVTKPLQAHVFNETQTQSFMQNWLALNIKALYVNAFLKLKWQGLYVF